MLKVNNKNTRTTSTPERRHWHRSGVFIVNFEHISLFSSVSIVDFEQVNVRWDLSWKIPIIYNDKNSSFNYWIKTVLSQLTKLVFKDLQLRCLSSIKDHHHH